MKKEEQEEKQDAWDWFGLSYSSFLVLPRIALQSMSEEWQDKFFKLVNEIEEELEFPEDYTGQYTISMRRGNKFVKNPFPHYRHNNLPKKKKED